jgi:hypothetical protein
LYKKTRFFDDQITQSGQEILVIKSKEKNAAKEFSLLDYIHSDEFRQLNKIKEF